MLSFSPMTNTKPEVTFTCNKRKMAKIEDLDHEIRETLKKYSRVLDMTLTNNRSKWNMSGGIGHKVRGRFWPAKLGWCSWLKEKRIGFCGVLILLFLQFNF